MGLVLGLDAAARADRQREARLGPVVVLGQGGGPARGVARGELVVVRDGAARVERGFFVELRAAFLHLVVLRAVLVHQLRPRVLLQADELAVLVLVVVQDLLVLQREDERVAALERLGGVRGDLHPRQVRGRVGLLLLHQKARAPLGLQLGERGIFRVLLGGARPRDPRGRVVDLAQVVAERRLGQGRVRLALALRARELRFDVREPPRLGALLLRDLVVALGLRLRERRVRRHARVQRLEAEAFSERVGVVDRHGHLAVLRRRGLDLGRELGVVDLGGRGLGRGRRHRQRGRRRLAAPRAVARPRPAPRPAPPVVVAAAHAVCCRRTRRGLGGAGRLSD
mmetsp:Transcript_11550/g.35594  ORF Transcript_11550/g.35594 Transcript_11550/m.35594 type:complete len:340 (+) Transcript_11550:1481-2500(+)